MKELFNVSSDFKRDILKTSRTFTAKVVIGDKEYGPESIYSISFSGGVQPSEAFELGSTVSQSVKVILNTSSPVVESDTIIVKIGLWVERNRDGVIIHEWEYVDMGTFYIDELSENEYNKITITGYDAIIKTEVAFSHSGYKTLLDVSRLITQDTGVQFADSVPATSVSTLPEGTYSIRQVLGFIASMMGGCMIVGRDGRFKVVKPSTSANSIISGANYFTIDPEKYSFTIGKMQCITGQTDDETGQTTDVTLSSGNLELGTKTVQFENPWMTQSVLDSIFEYYEGFTYIGYSVDVQGNPAIEPWDLVQLSSVKDVTYDLYVFSYDFTYNGGFRMSLSAASETEVKNSFSSKGDASKELEVVKANQGIFNSVVTDTLEAYSGKFDKLEADFAEIGELYVKYGEFETLLAESATIKDLTAETAKIGVLEADLGTFKDLVAKDFLAVNASITNLQAGKADIADLDAAVANIGSLQANVADINDLLAGNITSDNIQAGGITSDSLTIRNGFITNAMISSLVASKITSGTLDTSKVTIQGSSGLMLIKDNTIQIKDTSRVRVQIGKDASGDYNLYVWDKSGNLMFDATGLHEDGIKSGIIRDDMVSDDANINGQKINITSLITEINGNSTKISSSVINIDTTGQSLSVAFNQMSTSISTAQATANSASNKADAAQDTADEAIETTKVHTTQISTIQGQISTLIQDTTIESGSGTIKLKDAYSKLEQTVSGISVTVGNQQSEIDSVSGEISDLSSQQASFDISLQGLESKYSSLSTTVSKKADSSTVTTISNKVGSLESTVDGLNTKYSSLSTTVSKKADSSTVTTISNKVGSLENTVEGLNTKYTSLESTVSKKADGSTVTALSNKVSTLEQTTSGINATISEQQTQIDSVEGSVSSVSSKVTSLTADLNGFKTTVSSTYATKTETGKLTTRVSAVESELTPEGLTLKVSEGLQGGKAGLSTTYFVMDSFGLLIKKGGFSILNNEDKRVFYADVNGNLKISAELQAATGSFSGALDSASGTFGGNVLIKDVSDGRKLFELNRTGLSGYSALYQKDQQFFAMYEYSYGGTGWYCAELANPYPGGLLRLRGGGPSDVYLTIAMIGRGGMNITNGGLIVSGTKNRAINTKFGFITMNAYETSEPLFGDVGGGKTDEKGECWIMFDPYFIEATNTSCGYHVFIQSYNNTPIYVERRETLGFKVVGEPLTEFSWHVIGHQIGYEHDRNEIVDWEVDNGVDDFAIKAEEDINDYYSNYKEI